MAVATIQSQILPTRTLTFGEWVDRHSGRIMVLPAVLIMLGLRGFPLIISAYLSVARFVLAPGGFRLTFVGLFNFKKLLVGVQQYHFLGTFGAFGPFAWLRSAVAVLSLLYWICPFRLLRIYRLRAARSAGFGELRYRLVLLTLATLIGAAFRAR